MRRRRAPATGGALMTDLVLHAEPAEDEEEEELPAWSLPLDAVERIRVEARWPGSITEWAFAGSTGKGVRVAILDSGIEIGHPLVGEVQDDTRSVDADGNAEITEDEQGDRCGHGTACAGNRALTAPDCELVSVRVLGEGYTGSGRVMLAGLRRAIEQAFDVVNMSLSTTKKELATLLHELADEAYSGAPSSSRRRTTCRSRATRGASAP